VTPGSAEIAQISFYLSKEKQTFDSVIDPEADLASRIGYLRHDFEVDAAKCRFIYFQTSAPKTNPPWLDFANEKLPDDVRVAFSAMSIAPNGILLVAMEDRVFAATFGRSASSALAHRMLEPDFGIKTAMNMCGNEEIRQTKSHSNSITPTHIDRQVSKPSDAFTFGLSEAEDLRYISAHLKGQNNVTLQGRDNLTLKVIGKDRLTWDGLIGRCKQFLKGFRSKDYAKLFPNYRNFRAASELEIAALDTKLIAALKAKRFDEVRLAIPEFISEDEFSFSYSNYPKNENILYAFLDSSQLEEQLDLSKVSIDKLQNRRIYAYSALEDRILSHRRWSVYNCLTFEQKLGKRYFILNDGRWLEVDTEFYASIVTFMTETLHEEPYEVAYKDIDISDHQAKMNRENIFNAEVCKRRPTCILFDLAKLRIGTGLKNKEFCDILDLKDDDTIRIINCKPHKEASSINYLFSQSKFYCDAFLHDDTFLKEIRAHIGASTSPTKAKYLAAIPDKTEELNGRDFTLCLWLLYDPRYETPSKKSIPLISQYELKLMHDHLRKICKLRDIILRFVPVRRTNYKTSHKQKAAA